MRFKLIFLLATLCLPVLADRPRTKIRWFIAELQFQASDFQGAQRNALMDEWVTRIVQEFGVTQITAQTWIERVLNSTLEQNTSVDGGVRELIDWFYQGIV